MKLAFVFVLVCVCVGEVSAQEEDLPPMFKNPRQISGQARGEQGDPPGSLTVRVVQGAMRRTEHGDIVGDFPPGTPVHLVAVDRRGVVSRKTEKLDAGGRVVFSGLRTDGSVSYFVLTLLAREGAVDRLVSRPITMPPQVGMRVLLAGHAAGSAEPPADDLVGEEGPEAQAPPGEVLIMLEGDTDDVGEVELLEVGREEPIARVKATPSRTVVQPEGRVKNPVPDPALRDGVVVTTVQRRGEGLTGIAVELVDVGLEQATGDRRQATGDRRQATDAEGLATFEGMKAGAKVSVRATVHGRVLASKPFELPAKGGVRIGLTVDWQEIDSLRARFTGIADGADQVYVARAHAGDRPQLTPPFQLTGARGATTRILVFPAVVMSFHGGAQLDDDKLWFQVQFSIINPSVVPYDAGPKGLSIPLPRGFRGASVAEEMTERVKVDDERGLVWRGPVPPGQRDFIASFAVPVDDGEAVVELALPNGAFDSQLVLEDFAKMRVEAPPDLERSTRETEDGRRLVVLGGIHRRQGENLSLRIAGLPQHARWKRQAPLAVGVVVLALIGWLIYGVVTRAAAGKSRQQLLEDERESLLQALVQLEADHRRKRVGDAVFSKNRAQLSRRLETVYTELGAERPAAGGGDASS